MTRRSATGRRSARRARRREQERSKLEGRLEADPVFDHGVKLAAIVSMVVDHVGMIFLPEIDALRVVGRMAMPLFAYLVAIGIHRTRDRAAYLIRLLALFVFSQIPYGLLVGTKLNVFLSLLVGAVAASYVVDRKPWWAFAVLAAFAGFTHQQSVSYGEVGPLLVVAFTATGGHALGSAGLATAIFAAHAALTGSQFSRMAMFVAPLMPLVLHLVHWRSTSRWRWAYWMYPAHLAVFYLIAYSLGITDSMQR